MCGECAPVFNEWKKSHLNSANTNDTSLIHAEIAELKTQISVIVDSLQRLVPNDILPLSASLQHSTPVVSAGAESKTDDNNEDTIVGEALS